MMTQRKLTDSELAANVRQRNRVNSERRRQRLAIAGKVQLLTWIPDTLRRELDSVAAARGEPVSETAAALLSLGLKQITTTTPAATTKPTAAERTAELFDAPAGNDATATNSTTRDELMTMNTALGNVADKLSATSYAADAAVDRQDAERGTHRQ